MSDRLTDSIGRLLKLDGNAFKVPRVQTLQKGTDAILEYLRKQLPVDQ